MEHPLSQKRPRILVLYNQTEESEALPVAHPRPEELRALSAALRDDGWDVSLLNTQDDVDRIGHAVVVFRPTILFNLVDHFYGDNTQHAAVASLLDLFGYQYTGSDPLCLATCQERVRTRLLLADGGVPVPGFAVVRDVNAIPETDHLQAPLIVSQAFDDIYFDEGSRRPLSSREELEAHVSELATEFELPLLIEELREGRAISAVVIGHRALEVLPLVEQEWDPESEAEVTVLAQLDYDTAGLLRLFARRAFRILGCRDFARIDFLLDEAGEAWCIDVRSVADLFAPGGVFRVAAEHSDYGYESILTQIARSAHKRVPVVEPAEAAAAAESAPPADGETPVESGSGADGEGDAGDSEVAGDESENEPEAKAGE